MNHVVITGATGYLGQHLVREFSKSGHQVHAVVRPESVTRPIEGLARCCVYDGSYASLDAIFSRTPVDLVIHAAALTAYDTTADNIAPLIQSNLTLGIFLLQAMSRNDCRRFINTGSYWQHYSGEDYDPVCLYAAMKEAFEKMIDYYVLAEKFQAITLKLTDIYGPDDPRKKLFPLLDSARKTRNPLMMSGGDQRINLLYIDDAVRAYGSAAATLADIQMPMHHRFFAASPEAKKLREIVDLYCQLSGFSIPVEFGGRPYRSREVMVPFVGTLLPGWQPEVDLTEGIRQIVEK